MRCTRCRCEKEEWDRFYKTCYKCRHYNIRVKRNLIKKGLCERGDNKPVFRGGRCYEHYLYAIKQNREYLKLNHKQHNQERMDYYYRQFRN